MGIYEAILKRRSIREFKNKAVPYSALEKCVAAARVAPSAANRQLLEYIVVDDEALLPQMFDAVSIWGGVTRPQDGWPDGRRPRAYIVVLINKALETELKGDSRNTGYDVGFAVENMTLVAEELGLGSCGITSFNRGKVSELFKVPDKYEPGIMLALGYPDESPVLETMAGGSTKRWLDDRGQRHVPKRELKDILHRNKFP